MYAVIASLILTAFGLFMFALGYRAGLKCATDLIDEKFPHLKGTNP